MFSEGITCKNVHVTKDATCTKSTAMVILVMLSFRSKCHKDQVNTKRLHLNIDELVIPIQYNAKMHTLTPLAVNKYIFDLIEASVL